MYAFIRLGFMDEAAAFMDWIGKEMETIDEAAGILQLMYTLDGEEELEEVILDHLEGYRQSAPVRIGNAAYSPVSTGHLRRVAGLYLHLRQRPRGHYLRFLAESWSGRLSSCAATGSGPTTASGRCGVNSASFCSRG